MAKELADEPFCAVSFDRLAHLAGGGNTETGASGLSVSRNHGHEAAGAFEARLIDELEISPFPNVFVRTERGHDLPQGGSKDPPLLLVGNGEALAPLGAAALQDLPAVLGCHANQEAVRFGAAPGIRLKRSLALLGSGHFLLGRTYNYVPLRFDV